MFLKLKKLLIFALPRNVTVIDKQGKSQLYTITDKGVYDISRTGAEFAELAVFDIEQNITIDLRDGSIDVGDEKRAGIRNDVSLFNAATGGFFDFDIWVTDDNSPNGPDKWDISASKILELDVTEIKDVLDAISKSKPFSSNKGRKDKLNEELTNERNTGKGAKSVYQQKAQNKGIGEDDERLEKILEGGTNGGSLNAGSNLRADTTEDGGLIINEGGQQNILYKDEDGYYQ